MPSNAQPKGTQRNLLNNSGIVSLGSSVFLRRGHGAILQGVVGLPEKILAVILQAFVEDSKDENDNHGPYETADRVDGPSVEENCFLVAAVELKQRMDWLIV